MTQIDGKFYNADKGKSDNLGSSRGLFAVGRLVVLGDVHVIETKLVKKCPEEKDPTRENGDKQNVVLSSANFPTRKASCI